MRFRGGEPGDMKPAPKLIQNQKETYWKKTFSKAICEKSRENRGRKFSFLSNSLFR